MDKLQAKRLIKETFENSFEKEQYIVFIKNLLNSIEEKPFTYRGNYIPDAYKQYVKTVERIGKYSDGKHAIDVLVVKLQKDTSLDRARTMQRNFVAWYLNGSRGGQMKDAALVAFVSPGYDDWRFSLVKMDYRFKKSTTGKIKVQEEFTPARRWSFLVGANEKSHTAQSRLVKILTDDEHAPTLAELEEAFNIETVTKEFFLKYRELFLLTKEALDKVVENDPKVKADFDTNGVDTVNFAKKLLGQIVFLYFLQKKGWFGVDRDDDWGTGSKQFLRELFEGKHGRYQNFFNDILEPLFYEALRIDRSHDDDYYSRFNCKIPFLNGGLFDPIGNYDWVHTDINLPNDLFSNTRKNQEGDIGDGILDVFDRYNFTVREDEPLEKEVAIDPELLGKAYEKFNAIRPDNFDEFTKALNSGRKGAENKFNKKFGVYYTPREIVHYMCKQSLINYLATRAEGASLETPISKQDIEDLIEVGEMISEHEATALVKEQNINNGIQKSTEYTALLADSIRQNVKIIDDWLADITVCDPAVGSGAFPVGMMNEIVRARNVLAVFLKNQERNDYEFKRRCIEHSIYGVDIDPGAVEIAKLRLWLSLVVDEEDIKNIKPLPNLDYKIVCGNSLMGVEKNLFNIDKFNRLEILKPLFFGETNPTQKQEYKKQIDDLISQITNGHKEFDFGVYFSEVFHQKAGFDVVIANPPYIDSENMIANNPELRRVIKSTYSLTRGNWDIYIAFFEKGFELLGRYGVLSFITPDKWISKPFGDELRLRKTDNLYSIMKAGRGVFEEVNVDAIVSIFTKHADSQVRIYEYTDTAIGQKRIIEKCTLKEPYTYDWFFSGHIELLDKIDASKELLSMIGTCENACATSDAYKLKNFIEELPSRANQDVYYKIINTGTIGKYFPKWGHREMAYLGERYLYPVVNKKRFQAAFRNSYGEKAAKRKIIIKGLNLLDACLDDKAIFIPGKTTLFVTCDDTEALKLLLAIVNSKTALFYIRERYPASSYNQGTTFTKTMINNLPLPKIKSQDRDMIIAIVDQIIAITKDDDYLQNLQKQSGVKELEREIDQMVYKLYGLTEEEIRIVEDERK